MANFTASTGTMHRNRACHARSNADLRSTESPPPPNPPPRRWIPPAAPGHLLQLLHRPGRLIPGAARSKAARPQNVPVHATTNSASVAIDETPVMRRCTCSACGLASFSEQDDHQTAPPPPSPPPASEDSAPPSPSPPAPLSGDRSTCRATEISAQQTRQTLPPPAATSFDFSPQRNHSQQRERTSRPPTHSGASSNPSA